MKNSMRKSIRRPDQGFTLIEIVIVLLLISIFAVVAVVRQPHIDTTLRAQADILATHLRYAQMRALNSNEIWGIGFTNNSYWLFRNSNTPAHRRRLPAQDEVVVDLGPKGITLSTAAALVAFDTWGRPLADNLPLAANLPVTLTKEGGSQSLSITRNTGFIP